MKDAGVNSIHLLTGETDKYLTSGLIISHVAKLSSKNILCCRMKPRHQECWWLNVEAEPGKNI